MPTVYDPRHYVPVPTCHPGLRVRIRLPPAESPVRTVLPHSFGARPRRSPGTSIAVIRRRAPIPRVCRHGWRR
jgi:hypothetical protein